MTEYESAEPPASATLRKRASSVELTMPSKAAGVGMSIFGTPKFTLRPLACGRAMIHWPVLTA